AILPHRMNQQGRFEVAVANDARRTIVAANKDIDGVLFRRLQALLRRQPGFGHRGAITGNTLLHTAVRFDALVNKEQDPLVAETDEMFRGGIRASDVVNDYL